MEREEHERNGEVNLSLPDEEHEMEDDELLHMALSAELVSESTHDSPVFDSQRARLRLLISSKSRTNRYCVATTQLPRIQFFRYDTCLRTNST